jgi:hypothetical protein
MKIWEGGVVGVLKPYMVGVLLGLKQKFKFVLEILV